MCAPRQLFNQQSYTLTLDYLQEWLQLPRPQRSLYSPKQIISTLCYAATQKKTIQQAARELENSPHPNTIFNELYSLDVDTLTHRLNQTLASFIPKSIFNRKRQVAIDFKSIPTWIDEEKLDPQQKQYIIHCKPKDGTSKFYQFASIYLIKNNKRYTLAMVMIKRGMSKRQLVKQLLQCFREMKGKVKCLYLDREFFTVDVINFLKEEDIPFLMAARRTEGIKKLIQKEGVGIHNYTLTSGNRQEQVEIAVVGRYLRGKRGKHGRKMYAYAMWKYPFSVKSLHGLHQRYRYRFGIEVSHRMWEMARGRTTSKKSLIRFLFVGIAVLFYCVWVKLSHRFTLMADKSIRRKVRRQLTFQSFLTSIRRRVEEMMCYGDQRERVHPELLIRLLYLLVLLLSLEVIFVIHDSQSM
jgi:putative transposase